jgi:hypothetical protein
MRGWQYPVTTNQFVSSCTVYKPPTCSADPTRCSASRCLPLRLTSHVGEALGETVLGETNTSGAKRTAAARNSEDTHGRPWPYNEAGVTTRHQHCYRHRDAGRCRYRESACLLAIIVAGHKWEIGVGSRKGQPCGAP